MKKITFRFFPLLIPLLLSLLSCSNNYINRKYSSLLLKNIPEISLEKDGTITFSYETSYACKGGTIYFGSPIASQNLDYPHFRISEVETTLMSRKSHKMKADLNKVDKKRYDFAQIADDKIIMRTARLCLWHPKSCYERIYDFRFAYKKISKNYTRFPCFKEGPFVSNVLADSAVIWWRSDLPSDGILEFNNIASSAVFKDSMFQVKVNNLLQQSGNRYRAGLISGNDTLWSRYFEFTSPPKADSNIPVKFVYMSDSRSGSGGGGRTYNGVNHRTLKSLCIEISKHKPDFVLFGGDVVDGSTPDPVDLKLQLRSWKFAVEPLMHYMPFYIGIGNHEWVTRPIKNKKKRGEYLFLPATGENSSETIFAGEFVNPANGPVQIKKDYPPYSELIFSFDYGNCHFVSLNSDYFRKSNSPQLKDSMGIIGGKILTVQLDWLDNDLAYARENKAEHIIIFSHEPIFPCGGHADDGMWHKGNNDDINKMRERFLDIITRYKTAAYLCGHEHNYSRMLIDSTFDSYVHYPFWQIISGGAGAPFYAQDHDTPWASKIAFFKAIHHFCLLSVNGSKIELKVIDETGCVVEECFL
ncbi:MAG: metallophosphoesterase [bacterium]